MYSLLIPQNTSKVGKWIPRPFPRWPLPARCVSASPFHQASSVNAASRLKRSGRDRVENIKSRYALQTAGDTTCFMGDNPVVRVIAETDGVVTLKLR